MRLIRRYHFSASHRLHAPSLEPRVNQEIYGKCNNPYGHGHDYLLEVAVAGEPHETTGRLVPVGQLDRYVERVILKPMDRRDLNSEVDEFEALVPTTENLAAVVAARLEEAWPVEFTNAAARLEMVRIHETKKNIFEVSVGQKAPEGGISPGSRNIHTKANS